MKSFFGLVFLMCIVPGSLAQSVTGVDSLIVDIAETYKDLGAYYMEGDVSVRMRRGRQTQTTEYTLRSGLELPLRYLVETGGERARTLVVNDTMTWAFHPGSNQYWKNPTTQRHANLRTDFPDPVRSYARLDQIADQVQMVARDTSYVLGGENRPAYLLEVIPRRTEQTAGQSVTMLLWVDKNELVVLQERTTSYIPNSPYGPMSIRQTTSYRDVLIGGDIPDSLFVFVPPESTAQVTQIDAFPGLPVTLYGQQAETFALPELKSSNQMDLSDFSGSVVVLNFWATWCGPCRAEMGGLNRLYREWESDGLVVLAINEEESPEQVAPYIDNEKLDFPVLMDRLGLISRQYKVHELPTTFILDREGTIQAHWIGARNEEDFRREIQKWLD